MDRVQPDHQLFQPDWFWAWARVAGGQKRWAKHVTILTVRDSSGELLGVLPLAEWRLGPLRVLSSAGEWQPHRPIVAAAGVEHVVGETLGRFLARRMTAAIRLGPYLRSSAAFEALFGAVKADRGSVRSQYHAPVAICRAPATWDEYVTKVVGNKFVRRVEHYERRIAKDGNTRVTHVRYTDPEQAAILLGEIAGIEERSWLPKHGGQLRFAPPDRKREWTSLIEHALGPRGLLDCWILYFNERPSAFCFAVTTGSLRFVLANQYDEVVSQYRTGFILHRHVLEEGIRRGVRTFDFGDGSLDYKRLWQATPADDLEIMVVFPRTLAGRIGALADTVVRRYRRPATGTSVAEEAATGTSEERV